MTGDALVEPTLQGGERFWAQLYVNCCETRRPGCGVPIGRGLAG